MHFLALTPERLLKLTSPSTLFSDSPATSRPYERSWNVTVSTFPLRACFGRVPYRKHHSQHTEVSRVHHAPSLSSAQHQHRRSLFFLTEETANVRQGSTKKSSEYRCHCWQLESWQVRHSTSQNRSSASSVGLRTAIYAKRAMAFGALRLYSWTCESHRFL